ncbi:MAG TPA: MFS transporter [Gammaproteobacteria bacterium]|nr:MFS transporter [Gammaproteobacteria bacterium]
MPTDNQPATFQGNDRLLLGIILGVIAFWLFAQTTLNIAPDMRRDLGLSASTMDIAVAITALFSGIFIVVFGGLADRFGRVLIVRIGFYLSIVGALLVGIAPSGGLAAPFLMTGRALQGLSAACIMSASLALVKAYWQGAARQRAISLWSIGSWGGSGLSALFGGVMAQTVGWRWIFFGCAAVSVLGLLLMRGTPESRAASSDNYHFDTTGVITFLIAMLALQIVVTQGTQLGWTSLPTIALIVVTLIAGFLFLRIEAASSSPFVDFSLFSSSTYTGATISNFLLNAVAGILIVSLQLLQFGGEMTAQQAGMLTLGYAITIIAFIRVGEKLLQRFGARKPMLWGCYITGLSIIFLMPANLLLEDYRILAIIAYSLFGVGLAFYATPSTDAALSSLPENQAGAGSGIYKMASSLGAAFGVAISAAIFTALSNTDAGRWAAGVITFYGTQNDLSIRFAAMIALGFNLLMVVLAIVVIMLTIPGQKKAHPERAR